MILGYITTLEIEDLERCGVATITEKPAGEGVVSFALVFERELALARGAAESSHVRAHLHDHLISALGACAAGMAKRERLLGRGLSIEKFAENCIRATLHALNQQQAVEEAK